MKWKKLLKRHKQQSAIHLSRKEVKSLQFSEDRRRNRINELRGGYAGVLLST